MSALRFTAAALGVFLVGFGSFGGEPDTPTRPSLSASDQARVIQLGRELRRLECDGRFTEALSHAGQILGVLRRSQPDDWYGVEDTLRVVAELETILQLDLDQQSVCAKSYSARDEAKKLATSGQYKDAESIIRRELDVLPQLLGT